MTSRTSLVFLVLASGCSAMHGREEAGEDAAVPLTPAHECEEIADLETCQSRVTDAGCFWAAPIGGPPRTHPPPDPPREGCYKQCGSYPSDDPTCPDGRTCRLFRVQACPQGGCMYSQYDATVELCVPE